MKVSQIKWTSAIFSFGRRQSKDCLCKTIFWVSTDIKKFFSKASPGCLFWHYLAPQGYRHLPPLLPPLNVQVSVPDCLSVQSHSKSDFQCVVMSFSKRPWLLTFCHFSKWADRRGRLSGKQFYRTGNLHKKLADISAEVERKAVEWTPRCSKQKLRNTKGCRVYLTWYHRSDSI